ncbi:hypothetical protein [Bacteroides sp. 214]|uniref:hypothetical protein n=1 Tax=Bacteroides sp. 214 TaxID=2302935 RepID=UPI0013D3C1BF|nr:hypothetical protein [Bacteroides sp. 214]
MRESIDTIFYELSYAMNAQELMQTPLTVYSRIGETLVAFSYDGIKEIKLCDSIRWKYLADVFPEEYHYFKEHNSYLQFPIEQKETVVLVFVGGKYQYKTKGVR